MLVPSLKDRWHFRPFSSHCVIPSTSVEIDSKCRNVQTCCVLNFSIEMNNFENDWKRAKVSPIFKSGDEHMVNNYRTVSVLPIISKIIEKHVFNSFYEYLWVFMSILWVFYEYLSENHLITSNQSGFRPKHSCETALNCLIDRWLKNSDQGKLTGVLFIGLSKAFDTVNHNVLIHKLKSFDICANAVSKK